MRPKQKVLRKFCWGFGLFFSLSTASADTVIASGTSVPASITNVVALAAGDNHSVALRKDGTAVAWGSNSDGQTVIPAAATNLVAVSAGERFSVGLRSDGR